MKKSECKLIDALPKFLQRAVAVPQQYTVAPRVFQIFLQNDNTHWHINENYILAYCLSGSKQVFIAEHQINLAAGDAIILPAQIQHRFCTSSEKTNVLLFSFYARMNEEMMKKITGEVFFPLASERKILFDAVKSFAIQVDENEASFYFAIALHRIVRRLFTDLTEKNDMPEHDYEKIRQAHQIIQKNLHRRVTLSELAKALNVSVSALQKKFYAKMKCGVGRYALNQRLSLGSKLLRSTDMNIGEIALAIGFESEITFRRALKRETGYSPSQLRKISQGIIEPGMKLKSNGFPSR